MERIKSFDWKSSVPGWRN